MQRVGHTIQLEFLDYDDYDMLKNQTRAYRTLLRNIWITDDKSLKMSEFSPLLMQMDSTCVKDKI